MASSCSCGIIRQSVYLMKSNGVNSRFPLSSSSSSPSSLIQIHHSSSLIRDHIHLTAVKLKVAPKATAASGSSVSPSNDDDGVSLGTMKLPLNIDLQRFDSLLFQWANSLCQGANLPLPMPLKVDKIPGGARLGFITIGDGETEVLVYIDCVVSPSTDSSAPIFRAIRNGPLKEKVPPGEPRIMRSLMQALQKSVEISRL